MYHSPSGLYNEGVWHNCIAGYALLRLHSITKEDRFYERALVLSKSLLSTHFDAKKRAFRQRVHTPYWSHDDSRISRLYKPHFWAESFDCKSASQAAAISFFSLLYEHIPNDVSRVVRPFIRNFFDFERKIWISSLDHSRRARAVDQALCLIACLHVRHLVEQRDIAFQSGVEGADDDHHMIDLPPGWDLDLVISETRKTLLDRFGYSDVNSCSAYISWIDEGEATLSGVKERYSWQEIWIALALLKSSPHPQQDHALSALLSDMAQQYMNEKGLIAATPIASTVAEASSDGALHFYAGDNALWILLAYCVEQADIHGIGFPNFRDADMSFDTYVQNILLDPSRSLLRVSDRDRLPALWANTEYALVESWIAVAEESKHSSHESDDA